MIFDDVVVEDKGVWTQMCRQCANELGESYFWDDIPIDDLICGVKNRAIGNAVPPVLMWHLTKTLMELL